MFRVLGVWSANLPQPEKRIGDEWPAVDSSLGDFASVENKLARECPVAPFYVCI